MLILYRVPTCCYYAQFSYRRDSHSRVQRWCHGELGSDYFQRSGLTLRGGYHFHVAEGVYGLRNRARTCSPGNFSHQVTSHARYFLTPGNFSHQVPFRLCHGREVAPICTPLAQLLFFKRYHSENPLCVVITFCSQANFLTILLNTNLRYIRIHEWSTFSVSLLHIYALSDLPIDTLTDLWASTLTYLHVPCICSMFWFTFTILFSVAIFLSAIFEKCHVNLSLLLRCCAGDSYFI